MDYGCLRPMAELGIGLGWGRYFLVSYDFTYMWNQNMMRKLLDDTLTGTASNASDLYFHGLTITGRLEF